MQRSAFAPVQNNPDAYRDYSGLLPAGRMLFALSLLSFYPCRKMSIEFELCVLSLRIITSEVEELSDYILELASFENGFIKCFYKLQNLKKIGL